jgi:hypothetical protein
MAPDAQLVGEEPDQRLVRRSSDCGGGDVGPEDAVDRAVDVVRPGTRCQSDGEANVGIRQGSGPR